MTLCYFFVNKEVWDSIIPQNFLKKKTLKRFLWTNSSVVYKTFAMTFVLQQCLTNAVNLNGNTLILFSIV